MYIHDNCYFRIEAVLVVQQRKKRHNNFEFQAMVGAVHLDPWHAGIILLVLDDVLGWPPQFQLHLRAYSAYLDIRYGGVCHVVSGIICMVRLHLQSKSFCVSITLVASMRRTNLASREGGGGVVGREDMRMGKKCGGVLDLTSHRLEKTFRCWGQCLFNKGRIMRARVASCWLVDTLRHF